MKNKFQSACILLAGSFLFLNACKTKVNQDYSELETQSQDNASVQKETDQVLQDVATLIEGSNVARTEGFIKPCDASLDSSSSKTNKYILKYDKGSACGYINGIRSGSIEVSLIAGTKWSDANAKLKIVFNNFKIKNVSNKNITFNGTKYIENVTGGFVKNLAQDDSITHKIFTESLSPISITFDDGSKANWNIARKKVIKKLVTGLSINISGFGSPLNYTNVSEWGNTRKGTQFFSIIDQPIVFKDCNANNNFLAILGQKRHVGLVKEITIKYGVNAQGEPINDPCSTSLYGYNVSYKKLDGSQVLVTKPY